MLSTIFVLFFALSALAQNTSTPQSPPSNNSTEIRTTITLPPLYACSPSSWVYTAPVGPKYLGFFVSGTDSFIETFALPDQYTARTSGTFVWNCDLPPGLSVAAMFYVVQDGASGTDGHQTTTPDALVNAGTQGSFTGQCYGQNDPGAQRGILSLASSLDPSFSYTASRSAATSGTDRGASSNNGSSTPIGAIVGGVIGGLALIILLALLLIYLRRRHDRANGGAANDGASVYSGWTEKTRRDHLASMSMAGNGSNHPPPGTYYATDPEGNTILVMGQPPHDSSTPPLLRNQNHHNSLDPGVQETALISPHTQHQAPPARIPNAPKVTAPAGTLPEPMGDDEPRRPALRPAASSATAIEAYESAQSTLTARAFEPTSERRGALNAPGGPLRHVGARNGLEDPSSFTSAGKR